ncbi:MAG: phosphatase [Gammaproteobacteria bacterium]|nr:MAG: phosphatase [Gammaproteobacteria bacterium]
MIDLHTHTNASDGELSPEALLARAIDNGVSQLAITDHDTIAGYLSVRNQPVAQQLQLISGVEISTTWRGIGIHVVGLGFDVAHDAITACLQQQTQARAERATMILAKLAKANMPISLAEVEQLTQGRQIGRPHIAAVMVAKGYVNNSNQAFKKYLGAGKIGDIKSGWVTLAAAVEAITASGGVAVIAHPDHYQMTRTKLMALFDEFKADGGQAIEVISGRQPRSITEKYAHIAREKGFYASLGSDFHRPLSYGCEVGKLSALPSDLMPVWALFAGN